jgi:DNA-binding SARP family transcriptional activator
VSILEALDDLWPEADPREARNSLRVAASYARQAISPLRIELEQGTVRLAEGCWTSVDLWRLLSGSPRSCSPETAAPFLDQEVFSDIQDEWVDAARAQAQARARQILTAAS